MIGVKTKGNGGSSDQNNIPRVQRIVFDDTISGTREMQILKAINQAQPWDQSFAIAENEFYLIRAMSLNQPQYVGYVAPVFRYQVKNVGKNEDGEKYGFGGIPLTLDNLEFISATGASVSDFENLESTDKIFIEDLEGMTIADYVTQNAPIVIKDKSEGETIFLTGIAPDYISYWFVGESGTYGQGFAEATDLDFQSLSAVVDPLTVETVAEMIAEAALLKQDKLVAGVNIKNFNSISVLGAGNISIPVFPPPYLEELIPDSYRPNNTGNFILKGSYFTEGMTGTFEGQVLNQPIQVFSSNHAVANLTTGNIEGMFDVTLNNGTQRTFPDALFVVDGIVFKPTAEQWQDVSLANVLEEGKVLIEVFASKANALWEKVLDPEKDWALRWQTAASPLGTYPTNQYEPTDLHLIKADDSKLFSWRAYRHPAGYYGLTKTPMDGNSFYSSYPPFPDSVMTDYSYELRCVGGQLFMYLNNVLNYTFLQTVNEPLRLLITNEFYDFQNIKYVEFIE